MKIKDLVIPGDSTAQPAIVEALKSFGDTEVDHLTRVKSGDQTDLDWIRDNTPYAFAAHLITIFTTANREAVHFLVDEAEWNQARKLGDRNRRLAMAVNTWILDPDVRDTMKDERKKYLQWRVEFKGDDFRAARDKIFGRPRQ